MKDTTLKNKDKKPLGLFDYKTYEVIDGIFERYVFHGELSTAYNRIRDINSIGQSFPVKICKELKYEVILKRFY